MPFAYWRKCDFQIHTPRDPNWTGARPLGIGELTPSGEKAVSADVDASRQKWADDFVDQCAKRGLEAIALTDHHEMIMVPYVQRAIENRRKSNPDFDLWIFPGMELTAHGGVQCLILFDADLSEDWRKQAQGKLGIVYADLEEKASQGPKVTQITSHYPDIGPALDELDGLKGRYIVLPNVSQGGKHTVLTEGEHVDFRRMSYVGGYLDQGQTINTLGSKNKTRLSGEDKMWSLREIYPIPTSDCRAADYASLGQNNTWVKLAAPTAEALRQAFLGHRSRIRVETPNIPALTVVEIQIDNSTILQPTTISLSPEFNSVIGGRGSGKSCFLEYLSFGLGRSCYDVPREHYSNTERMKDLITDTLTAKGGGVTLTVMQDQALFKVTRGPATAYQPQITYPNGSAQTITVKELRALFPAVVYSQGELSEIGKQAGKSTQLSDLLQFVNPEFKRDDDKLNSDIETAKASVRTAVLGQANFWAKQAKLRKLVTSRDSLRQRIDALEKTLPALSEADQATVKSYDDANDFETKRIQASKHAEQISQDLGTIATELLNERDLAPAADGEPKSFQQAYKDLYAAFSTGLKTLQKDIADKKQVLAKAESDWTVKFKTLRAARDAILEKLGAHKTVTSQIIKLREEATDITNQIGDLEAEIKGAGDPAFVLNVALKKLRTLNDTRAKQTQKWANEIEALSSGKIKATVVPTGEMDEIREAVDTVSAKTGSQEAGRMKRLEDALAGSPVWDVVDRLRSDCLSILYWRQVGATSGEEKPKCDDLMNLLGGTEKTRSAVTELMDTARVEAMASAVPRPQITLTYSDGSKEISFEKASEGQRAAALLFMLLQQSGGPLIIDQPEGDLDNRIIADLTDKLHSAKQNRQLIFASHNANIVVNGSSELVGFLDVKDDGLRQFDCAGAIDEPPICKVITSTMEGGEKAFKDRQDKYGY